MIRTGKRQSLLWAFCATTVAALLVACANSGGNAMVPRDVPFGGTTLWGHAPAPLRVQPFKNGPSLGKSDHESVFALFNIENVPVGSATPEVQVFGVPATSGPGSVVQFDVALAQKNVRRAYLDGMGRPVEITDAATHAAVLVTYKNAVSNVITVCIRGTEIGTTTQEMLNGVMRVVRRRASGACPAATGDTERRFISLRPFGSSDPPPSDVDMTIDIGMITVTTIPDIAADLGAAASIAPNLSGIDDSYTKLGKSIKSRPKRYLAPRTKGACAIGVRGEIEPRDVGCVYAPPSDPIDWSTPSPSASPSSSPSTGPSGSPSPTPTQSIVYVPATSTFSPECHGTCVNMTVSAAIDVTLQAQLGFTNYGINCDAPISEIAPINYFQLPPYSIGPGSPGNILAGSDYGNPYNLTETCTVQAEDTLHPDAKATWTVKAVPGGTPTARKSLR